METLFKETKTTYRRSNGQFATKEMAFADKTAQENAILRYDVEKYKRAYLTTAKRCAALERELKELKDKIKNLVK